MKNKKVIPIKGKQLQKKAKECFENFECKHAQNPIVAKALAFKEAKKNITSKDLF